MLEGEEIFPACPRYGSCPAAKEYWSKQPRGEAEAHETARLYINEDKLRAGAIPKEIFVWLAEKYISARLAACAGGTLELKTKEPEPPTRVVVWDGFADRPDAGVRMERANAALASGQLTSVKITDTHVDLDDYGPAEVSPLSED